jgi:FtsH-binding integral membrane protein
MSELVNTNELTFTRKYWAKGLPGQLAMGLSGIIAVLVALKTITYEPGLGAAFAFQDHFFRVLSFAALTVWTTFAIGIRRRGPAAMITLGFAIFVELILSPMRNEASTTLVSTNFGIVLAYCGMQLYWLNLVNQRLQK